MRVAKTKAEAQAISEEEKKVEEPERLPTLREKNPRLEAVRLFSLWGSVLRVSEELQLPYRELLALSKTQWWEEQLAMLQREEAAQLNTKLSTIHGMTLEMLEDRLQFGDKVRSSNGTVVRKDLPAAVIAKIADVIFTQRQLVRKQPTNISVNEDSLDVIAKKLRAIGMKDPASLELDEEGNVIDVEVKNDSTDSE